MFFANTGSIKATKKYLLWQKQFMDYWKMQEKASKNTNNFKFLDNFLAHVNKYSFRIYHFLC